MERCIFNTNRIFQQLIKNFSACTSSFIEYKTFEIFNWFLPDKPAYSVSYNKNLLSANTPTP